jgi:hypothetical protein
VYPTERTADHTRITSAAGFARQEVYPFRIYYQFSFSIEKYNVGIDTMSTLGNRRIRRYLW